MMKEPRLRFKEFRDGWKEKRIRDLLKIKNGKSQKEVEDDNGRFPILATSGVIGRTNSYLYDSESVLIGRKGTINKPRYMNTPFWTVDTLFYSEIHENNDGKFLYYLFQTINWEKYNTSTGVPSLTSSNIESINVFVPKYREQQEIANFLSNLDNQIKLQSDKLEALKLDKKGYLQKMFPSDGSNRPRLRFKGFNDEWKKRKLTEVAKVRTGNKNVEDNDPNGKYLFFDRSIDIKKLNTYDYTKYL